MTEHETPDHEYSPKSAKLIVRFRTPLADGLTQQSVEVVNWLDAETTIRSLEFAHRVDSQFVEFKTLTGFAVFPLDNIASIEAIRYD